MEIKARTVHLEEQDWKKFKELAKQDNGKNASQYLRELIAKEIKKHERK